MLARKNKLSTPRLVAVVFFLGLILTLLTQSLVSPSVGITTYTAFRNTSLAATATLPYDNFKSMETNPTTHSREESTKIGHLSSNIRPLNKNSTILNGTFAAFGSPLKQSSSPSLSSLPLTTNALKNKTGEAALPTSNVSEGIRASKKAESLIGSMLNPKSLLASAIDEIRNSTQKNNGSSNNNGIGSNMTARFVHSDHATIILSNEIIPSQDFIYVYGMPLEKGVVAHITSKLPCNLDAKSQIIILTGHSPRLEPATNDVSLIKEMSSPGKMCLYGLKIRATPYSNNTTSWMDIALANPGKSEFKFPPASSLSVYTYELK
jgi:hypothetical protein